MIRHPTTLRKRKTIDSTLPSLNNETTKISPRKSMHTPHQKYYIPPLYPDKSEQCAFQNSAKSNRKVNSKVRKQNSVESSVESILNKNTSKTGSRQRSEDKIIVYDIFNENQKSKVSDFQITPQGKRYSLPILKKGPSPSSHESEPFRSDISNYKTLWDNNIVRKVEQLPKSTERILDLLMLNTCELKKVFQKQTQSKMRRKIVVQGRIPQDFFSILKQF